ncbi:MAG: hypothetical protein U9P72_03460 [Campylobacterota bacterium]|nr:hypothetical protein [Campylobacterota bacterium]
MIQILKRLELIKTAITIEDEDIIELQISKIKTLDIDDKIKLILEMLNKHDYGNAVVSIEDYISNNNALVVYDDQELQGLKLELKVLENKLQELNLERDEYQNNINEFNTQYNLSLGDLIKNILKLSKEILHRQTTKKKKGFQTLKAQYNQIKEEYLDLKVQKDELQKVLVKMEKGDERYAKRYEKFQNLTLNLKEKRKELDDKKEEAKEAKVDLDDDPIYQEYKDVKKEYEEFTNDYEEIKKEQRYEINANEKKELKKIFRQASKLCHPDIVTDAFRDQATNIMKELNSAYAKKDLSKVREILHSLENGINFTVSSDSVNDKDLLKSKIIDLRIHIDASKEEIKDITTDQTFITIQEIDDWDEYFQEIKISLEQEYDRLLKDI